MSDNIKVAVRMRGLIPREIQNKAAIHWVANDCTSICQNNSGSTPFAFDRVFKSTETNDVIYQEFCSNIVNSVINGFNGTIFAYGQTSSGKTFTIMGDDSINMGIAQYTVSDLFDHIQNLPDREFLLRVSYMEIYNEMVIDLLSNSNENLKLQEDQYGNIKVNKLTETIVQEPNQVLDLMRKGQRQRKTGDTIMNNKSSRSHSIFRMIIESGIRGKENAAVNVSHFNLVDLAGSEKASLNAPKGTRFKEGVNINKSLFMLSQVISQLSAEKEHQFINYRDSKLTRILQNSLGGNALTAIICTVTPASLDETLSTLKFALRAKKIKNKPQINEVETEQALLKKYANKIKKLHEELEATKEEKDQEKKKRTDMQQQIENLKKKFVTYIAPSEISRAARRETWGGCLDVARLKMFLPPKDLLFPHEINMKEDIENLSTPFSQERLFHREKLNSKKSLPVLQEESDTNIDLFDGDEIYDFEPYRNRLSTLSSKCSIGLNNFECFKSDVAIQTDERLLENLEQNNEIISSLRNELSELKEFTRLEKQICRNSHPETKISESRETEKENSPVLSEQGYIENVNTPIEEFNDDVFKNLADINAKYYRNEFNLEHEKIFNHLTKIINKFNKFSNAQIELGGISNPYFKVIFQLFNLIFKSHCFLNTGSKIDFSKKVDNMFVFLQKILIVIDSDKSSYDSCKDLILKFGDITDLIFKEIEVHQIENLDSVFDESKIYRAKKSQTSFCENHSNMQECQTKSYENRYETKESQTSFYEKCNETKESQTSFYEKCNEAKESQTSFYEKCNEAKESQTSFCESSNEAKESQTSFQENDYKGSQTSFDLDDIKEKESQTSFNESISNSNTICEYAEKINLLEANIQKYLKEMCDLHNSSELKEKQVSLAKEKITIQEQIISSLKDELVLRNKEVINNVEKTINQTYLDLKHSASQTYYLNSKVFSPIKDEMNESMNCEQCIHKDCIEETSGDLEEQFNIFNEDVQHDYTNSITNIETSINQLKSGFNTDQTKEQYFISCEMNTILEELSNLKSNALKIMKDNVGSTYCIDVFEKKLQTQEQSPLELVKFEIKMLQDVISQIELYTKNGSEASDSLKDVLEKQVSEISSLQQQCSETKISLKEKETQLDTMSKSLSSFRDNIIKRLSTLILYSEFDEVEENASYICDINYIEKAIKVLEKLVSEKESALIAMKECKEKQSNGTQTDESYPDIIEIREKEKCAQEEIISLKQTVKELSQESKDLYQDLQLNSTKLNELKEFYEKKLEDAVLLCETKERNAKIQVKECIKNIEEKYEQEMNNQEKEFFAKIKELGETYQQELKEKDDNNKEELSKLKSFHDKNISKLEEYYKSLLSDPENDSGNFELKLKLEEEIRQYKKREENLKHSYISLKNKFKQYMVDVKTQMRAKTEKSFADKEIQTNFETVSHESGKSNEVCKQCILLQQQLINLRDQMKIKNAINQLDGPESNKDLMNELSIKRTKVISLQTDISNMTREIAALKKELLSKSTLLKSCNCRMIPKTNVKPKKPETIQDACKEDKVILRLEKMKDVLELDIVQKAIENAKDEQRYAIERDMGPASEMKCLLLQRKLHKKDKEILELKDMLVKKSLQNKPLVEKKAAVENKVPEYKLAPEQRHPSKFPQENEENFTPYKRLECPPVVEIEHQKFRPKNILTEKNKPAQSEEPVKKMFQTVPATDEEKEFQRQFRILTGEPEVPECKQQ